MEIGTRKIRLEGKEINNETLLKMWLHSEPEISLQMLLLWERGQTMNQRYYCNHCGEQQPTIFLVFLHIFTDHMHLDMGLAKQESLDLLPHCHEYDRAYYKLMYETLPKLPNIRKEN